MPNFVKVPFYKYIYERGLFYVFFSDLRFMRQAFGECNTELLNFCKTGNNNFDYFIISFQLSCFGNSFEAPCVKSYNINDL